MLGLILILGILTGQTNANGTMSTLGKLTKVEETPNSVVAHYESGQAVMQIFKPGIYHLTIRRGSESMKSFAVIESPEDLSGTPLKLVGKVVEARFPDGTVKFDAQSGELSYSHEGDPHGLELEDVSFNDTGFTARFNINGARNFFGLGEKTLPFNKYGSSCTMWNSDFPAYNVKFDPLYESIPFLLKAGPHGAYGLFFDNTCRSWFDVGKSDSNQLVYSTAGGDFELYLITGRDAAEVVKRFSELTGRMHMPPIWALGYQQSRWSYYPESRVLDLAHGFRENKIPCDVIYLDINYMDGYKCFTWSPKDFPTPRRMLDTLHDLGFKVVTIIDPGIKDEKGYDVYDSGVREDVFAKKTDGSYFVGSVWPGKCVFPDFFNPKARDWWGRQYRFLLDSGVDGFWNDMNEPSVFDSPNKTFDPDVVHRLGNAPGTQSRKQRTFETATHAEVHNAYGMEMVRATRDGLEKLEPDKRPLVLTRANYAGGQRYAAMWTGDNFASFAHLKLALVMFLNIGVSGQPFVGSDVGGFIGDPSPELFSRWLELGVFSPFFRTHSVWDSKPREPWAFGEKYTELNRKIIDARYRLLPEIYTAFRDAHETGLPIVRPLYLDFPGDTEVYNISDEFTFGSKLLVAPVLDSGKVKRSVYLPAGNWIDMNDRRPYDGGWHDVDAPLGMTPVFVKKGTIVFTQSPVQSTSEQADTLSLRLFGGKSGSGSSYFDDGTSLDYRNGKYMKMTAECHPDGKEEVVKFETTGEFVPGYTYLKVEMPFEGPLPFREGTMETTGGNKTFAPVLDNHNGLMSVTFPFSAEVKSIVLK